MPTAQQGGAERVEGGWVLNPSGNFRMPSLICTTNEALEVDTGACTVVGILGYAIISGL